MAKLSALLPKSLVARIYALYSAALLFFVGGGLALFYQYQFSLQLETAQQSATMLIEVTAQTIADSAVDCDLCDEPLPELRRQAIPGVRLCIDCHAGIEKHGFFIRWNSGK